MKATIVLLLLLPVICSAQLRTVSGKVVDVETADPLIGALVQIQELGLQAWTDIKGEFRIDSLPEGIYLVEVWYPGYYDGEAIACLRSLAEDNITCAMEIQYVDMSYHEVSHIYPPDPTPAYRQSAWRRSPIMLHYGLSEVR